VLKGEVTALLPDWQMTLYQCLSQIEILTGRSVWKVMPLWTWMDHTLHIIYPAFRSVQEQLRRD
jgi:hypothetical protein